MARKSKKASKGNAPKKRQYRPRPFPSFNLEQSLTIGRSISDNNAGKPYSRLSLAESLNRSPESSAFRGLITSSSAYGITEGSFQAKQIKLTSLGLEIVAPRTDEEKQQGLIKAAMNVDLFRNLYKHFDQHKIPSNENFKNTLIRDHSVEASLTDECIKQYLDDGNYVGLIRHISNADRVTIPDAGGASPPSVGKDEEQELSGLETPPPQLPAGTPKGSPKTTSNNPRVFITHGKKQEIVSQLKSILNFGKLIPVVAKEHETLSKPVPEKVLDDMRSCLAGIIHVASEEELLDREGKVHHKINENVLIEIGAAMALYKGNFILLVEKGIHLPSNLQGLYRCEYEGDKLDSDATMKVLKVISEFRFD